MGISEVSFTASFLAGVISFLSPCVLPLVPGYLSYISGVSLSEIKGETVPAGSAPGEATPEEGTAPPHHTVARVGWASFFFVLGFSTVFIGLGATATSIGQVLQTHQVILSRVAGVVVIVFGLHLLGVFQIGFLYRDKRFDAKKVAPGALGAYLIGLAFAFGWTPCIGPILATILAMAAVQETMGQGVLLLSVYSLGLGVPFLAVGFGMRYFLGALERIKRHMRVVEITSGVLLILIGILMVTRNLTWLNKYLSFLNQFSL